MKTILVSNVKNKGIDADAKSTLMEKKEIVKQRYGLHNRMISQPMNVSKMMLNPQFILS
jgi:hypothetical protein